MNDAQINDLTMISLLSDVTAAGRAALEKRCRWRHYDPHELIIDRQSTSQDIFFIAEER